MARLYPPITEETLPAFCLTYNTKGEKVGAVIKVNFNLNRAVANSEIDGLALRLRTISTNTKVVDENLNINPTTKKSEGIALSYDLDEGVCTFSITKEYNSEAIDLLKVGQYYKAQIAFINKSKVNNIGYWSTVAVIKCVAMPTVKIANFHTHDINIFSNEIVGEYLQDPTTGDYTEKVYSYNFELFDIDGKTILEKTKELLHNSSQDIINNASTDIYRCYRELEENEIYYIKYNIKTVNGLEVSSPKYQLMNIGTIDPEENIILKVFNGLELNYNTSECSWLPCEEGVMEIYITLASQNLSKTITGSFVLLRSSSKDNFTTWQEVKRFRLNNEIPSKRKIYDYTIEQGIKYKYAVQQYNRQGFYSNKVYAQSGDIIKDPFDKTNALTVRADFEDMFLYDGERQLKIRFNPKVSSFKNTLQEQKIDTIGSKYPFIFRNGNVCYKEFPISGLISFQEDDAQFFMTKEDYSQMELDRFEIPLGERKNRYQPPKKEDYIALDMEQPIYTEDLPVYQLITTTRNLYEESGSHEISTKLLDPIGEKEFYTYKAINSTLEANRLRLEDGIQLYKENIEYSDIYRGQTYNQTDLTSENIMSERYFKLAVLDWLTDGKPKLFKSPTEGNYIVRLLNVSLSPNDTLGRMLHTFSCTAYEIAEFNYDSLIEFGLLKIEEPNTLETQWNSYNIVNLLQDSSNNIDEEGYYLVDLDDKIINSFSCTGFAPGDKIKLIIEDKPEPIIITIGQTGSYIYEDAEPILSISILPIKNTQDLPRDLFFETLGYTYQKFDMISSINIYTQKEEQIVGKSNNLFEKTVVNTGHNLADKATKLLDIKNYQKANNVYLSESFEEIKSENINEEIYNKNLYYKFNGTDYVLPINEFGQLENYNSSTTYYKRKFSGEKIITTEILYLHAKRREIIPIFIATPGDSSFLDNLNLSESTYFMVTPFGNGYVRYKSISPHFTWKTAYGNLTAAERQTAKNVHDLTEFMINKGYADRFCLFQVYVPHNTNNTTIWEPYDHTYYVNPQYCGIFDPYLYNKEVEKGTTNAMTGWWRAQDVYDPSIYISYNEDANKYTETISLQNNIEIKLKDIKLPTELRTGSGVAMEVFYRLKYLDYTIENENKKIKKAKQNYLNIKQQAEDKKSIYRKQVYFKNIGDALANLNENEINIIINSNDLDYVNTAKRLAELARKAQISSIRRYLNQEKIITNSFLNQLSQIDNDLIEKLKNNEVSIFYKQNITTPKTKYINFIDTTVNTSDNTLLPSIQKYETNKTNINKTNNLLQSYYNNIQKNGSAWNFINITNTKILPILKTGYLDKQEEIQMLEENQYVGQYIEYLEDLGKNIFLKQYSIENQVEEFNFNTGNASLIAKIGNWIKKKDANIETLKNYEIFDEKWDEYFHVGGEDSSLPLLGSNLIQSEETYKYSIANLDKYLPTNVKNEIGIDLSSKLYTLNFIANINGNSKEESLILIIKDYLDYLNSLVCARNKTEYKTIWEIEWTAEMPKALDDFYPAEDETYRQLLTLGIVNFNSYNNVYNIEKSKLEQIIDDGFKTNKLTNSSTINDIKNFITNIYNVFPESLVEQLGNIIYSYISSGIRDDFQDIYDFYIYKLNSGEELTDNQINFIQQQLRIYQEDLESNTTVKGQIWQNVLNLNNTKSSLYKFIHGIIGDNNAKSLEGWYTDWNFQESLSEVAELKNIIKNYINIFNKIISAKNNASTSFKAIRRRILSFKNDPNISASDNIKEILFEEEQSYYNSYERVLEELNFFITRLSYLQQSLDYEGYLDFLNNYISLLKNSNSSQDNENYNKFLQQIFAVKQTGIIDANKPYKQNQKVINAWKEFLDALALEYRRIEKTGRLD